MCYFIKRRKVLNSLRNNFRVIENQINLMTFFANTVVEQTECYFMALNDLCEILKKTHNIESV